MVMVMVGGLMMMMMSWTSPVKLSRCPVFIKAGCDRYKGWQRSYDNPALMRLELCYRLTIARGNTIINLPFFIFLFCPSPRQRDRWRLSYTWRKTLMWAVENHHISLPMSFTKDNSVSSSFWARSDQISPVEAGLAVSVMVSFIQYTDKY